MLAARVILVIVVPTVPRPVFSKDFDLVGAFVFGTAIEKLGEFIDVLSVAVGERRQEPLATGVPVQIADLRAAADKTQDASGGCESIDPAEVEFGQGLCSLLHQQ